MPGIPKVSGVFTWVLLLFCVQNVSLAEPVNFNLDIRPLLSDRCFFCHGPDASNRAADLRLDTENGAIDAGVVVPGKPDESELIRRISSHDPDEKMPPIKSKLSLSKTEIQTLRQWIAEGATYQSHWSFIPPQAVEIPELEDLPQDSTPLDHFIERARRAHGLVSNPPATKEKLLRRVSFDLTGLPPTLAELDEFLADMSPDAYERAVDRLLASERYGERMASEWLDVARYSDSYGYQVDRDRFVWPWRDWVIKAFNQNMPYDDFIIKQLAGDLLPNATREDRLATTFNRLHSQKVEGGSVPEEFRIEYVADRTQTVGTAFLGLTLECCRCHDHKYDPLTQTDYYQLTAFFNNIDEAGLYSFFTPSIPTPTLLLPTDAQTTQLNELQQRVSEEETKLSTLINAQLQPFQKWLNESSGPPLEFMKPLAHLDFEENLGGNQRVPGKTGAAVQLTGDDAVGTTVGNFVRSQPFSVSLWLQTPDVKERAVIYHRSRAWTDAASRGYELLLEEGCLSAALIHFWPGNAIRVITKEPIPTREWLQVTVTYDGSSRAAGLKIYVNGAEAATQVVRDHLYKQITGGGGDHIAIGERFRDRGFTQGLVDEFKVFDRELTAIEIKDQFAPGSLQQVWEQRNSTADASHSPLYPLYLASADEAYRTQLTNLQEVRKQRDTLLDGVSEIMTMAEMPERRSTYRLTRGAYDARAEEVLPAVPSSLPSLPAEVVPDRLAFARWLTDPQHPLTARVAVNRYWQMLFGSGLVRTPEDFGSQGELPTHPELLDWLARDFIDHGWDVKRLVKQIVMSQTYRQSAELKPQAQQIDPQNRWLARAPSYRLPAEMLRDNALQVSGLLVNRIGGAPAKPYEVEVSFKPVAREKGEGLYRRSVYTYWKRTGPAPVMMTLDASKRDVCSVKRERTASPLQAFVMLNGPQFVEASRVMAQRLLEEHGTDSEAALRDLFRMLTSRTPQAAELAILNELFAAEETRFAEAPERAVKYLSVGDAPRNEAVNLSQHAALTAVANALMNFDECVIKR